ncbi:transcription factor bHLH13-like [Selaginella moellendorffii]|uniref:transcription factor bHLH13-like n=1 Tax=Selaginella moellendorffii TaxID=88036 RepID=UPI000D1CC774|nr:transcription factor bHLH13-like [Selaginella moellendorffii]|eukprot:XP_024517245.1 transcription factor bHLH13-like [Selaginella moellendorffii]
MPTKFSGARSALCELHDLCHPEEDYREVDHVTDQESFYLLSKSWNFACGEGIPGRAFQFGQHIWICDTVKPINFHCARLELAKSAGIQTIVCVPTRNGVVELGSTEIVNECSRTLQDIRRYFEEEQQQQQSQQQPRLPQLLSHL